MDEVIFREARPADFEAILALWASIEERHTGLPDKPEYLQRFHDFSPDLLLVAELDGRIVGSVIGGWDGWRAQIARLSVGAGVRRRGIARELVNEIESRLYERGARRIYALVERSSALAGPFWEAAGYAGNDDIAQFSGNLED